MMMTPHVEPPGPGEYAAFYANYVERAIRIGPVTALRDQPLAIRAACGGLSGSDAFYRYEPGKWSVKEVLGHLTDAERVFSYRLFRVSRGDSTPLSGFDETIYVREGGFDRLPVDELVEDFTAVRESTTRLVRSIQSGAWTREGVANGVPVTARALLHILVGHVDHHLALLRERYRVEFASAPQS